MQWKCKTIGVQSLYFTNTRVEMIEPTLEFISPLGHIGCLLGRAQALMKLSIERHPLNSIEEGNIDFELEACPSNFINIGSIFSTLWLLGIGAARL